MLLASVMRFYLPYPTPTNAEGFIASLTKAEYWSDLHFEIHLNSSSQYEQ